MHPDELLKAKQKGQADWERENNLNQAQVGKMMGMRQEASTTLHPREILLSNVNDQEQALLVKLHALREIRQEICSLPRDEAERLLKVIRLTERLTYTR